MRFMVDSLVSPVVPAKAHPANAWIVEPGIRFLDVARVEFVTSDFSRAQPVLRGGNENAARGTYRRAFAAR
jgi:hypothetical protein